MNIVRRSRYLDRLIAFQDTDLIKIVTGIRRCGKTTLLDMMREHLAQQGVPAERLLTFKMESLEYAGITDYLTFYRMVRERVDGVDRPSWKRARPSRQALRQRPHRSSENQDTRQT